MPTANYPEEINLSPAATADKKNIFLETYKSLGYTQEELNDVLSDIPLIESTIDKSRYKKDFKHRIELWKRPVLLPLTSEVYKNLSDKEKSTLGNSICKMENMDRCVKLASVASDEPLSDGKLYLLIDLLMLSEDLQNKISPSLIRLSEVQSGVYVLEEQLQTIEDPQIPFVPL